LRCGSSAPFDETVTVENINESLTAERYRVFSQINADLSPTYTRLALEIADDAEMLRRIDTLPPAKRQAGFLFSAARYLDITIDDYVSFRDHLVSEWPSVERLAEERTVQTNDPARLLAMLPVLARIDGPVALLEVGASAGLCLNLDRYSYRYDGGEWLHPADGPSTVALECSVRGDVPVSARIPEVVWRAGIDLNPLYIDSEEDTRWLRALLWPDNEERRRNVDAAIEVMREHPVHVTQGDLNDELLNVVAQAPQDATLVIMHSAVLSYLTQSDAERFVRTVSDLDAVWIANEMADIVPGIDIETGQVEPFSFVVSEGGLPVAHAHPHGEWIRWLKPLPPAVE